MFPTAFEQHHTDVLVRFGAQEQRVEFLHHIAVQGVAPLGLVQHDLDYTAAASVPNYIAHVNHTIYLIRAAAR